jgi:hypothetical protein
MHILSIWSHHTLQSELQTSETKSNLQGNLSLLVELTRHSRLTSAVLAEGCMTKHEVRPLVACDKISSLEVVRFNSGQESQPYVMPCFLSLSAHSIPHLNT